MQVTSQRSIVTGNKKAKDNRRAVKNPQANSGAIADKVIPHNISGKTKGNK